MSGFGRGGRGAALLKLLEEPPRKPGSSSNGGQNGGKNGGQQQGAEAIPKKPPPTGLSFGRGFAPLSKEEPKAEAPKVLGFGRGLGALTSLQQPGKGETKTKQEPRKTPSPPSDTTQQRRSPEAPKVGPGGDARFSPPRVSDELSEGVKGISFQKQERGTAGREVSISANYIPIRCKNKAVWQYAIFYEPEIDSKGMRRRLLFEHSDVIGKVRAFDGSILYLPIQLEQKVTVFTSIRPTDEAEVTVKVQLVKTLEPESCTHLYNVIFKRIMRILQMQQVGRHYYQPKLRIPIPQHRLEVWPGYITAIQEFSGGLMLQCDVSHKVLNYETILDTMSNIFKNMQSNKNNYKDECVRELVGCIVLTRYNNQTYRVDDINWDLNPQSTFTLRKGETLSYQEYYKRNYDIDISDGKQPLLVNWPKKRQPDEEITPIHLVPELCSRTGLTDKMREDFKVMKDLAMHTRVTPNQRHLSFRKFIENVSSSQEATQELADWGLVLDKGILQLKARQLPSEKILFKHDSIIASAEADWGRELSRNSVITPVDLQNWLVIFTKRDQPRASDFINCMKEVCPKMGIHVGQPIICTIQDDRTQTYLTKIRNTINPQAIHQQNHFQQKTEIKKALPRKIALQKDCKMGGELWALNIPLGLMVAGIDVYHERNRPSIGAFVASMNSTLTRWYSRTCFQQHGQELIDGLKVCMTASLRKYHEVNHCLPEKIVIYRDGVGDGQLSMVATYEKEQLSECFAYFDDYHPSNGNNRGAEEDKHKALPCPGDGENGLSGGGWIIRHFSGLWCGEEAGVPGGGSVGWEGADR
ncbi:putative seali [Apostichopus japonicus]|uniref:Putative seali n=1 Tax=Stichopus japonicus TaxID=307972 RepID=A0A2G8KSU2_STIJA|nr:putative seali [Apostichopus japonicus]